LNGAGSPLLSAAVVLEFSPSIDADLDAILLLAEGLPHRIVAVARQMSPARQRLIEERFANFPHVEFRSIDGAFARGASIRLGLQSVRETIVAIVNIDLRPDPKVISRAMRDVDGNLEIDILLISREKRGRASRLYNTFANILLGIGVSDVQAPLKIFRMAAIARVIDKLQLPDHGFDADLLFHARREGLRISEERYEGSAPISGSPPLNIGLRAIGSLLLLRTLESRVGRNPIVIRLGRPHMLPARRSYRILIFCWRDPASPKAGGGEVYLLEQARAWVRQGHTVTWIAQRFANSAQQETIDGISIIRRGRSLFVFPAAVFWYVFTSGWQFDFLLDVMNGIPFFTPIFSGKPRACLLYHVHAPHFRDELPRPLSDLAIAVETRIVPWIYRRTPFLTISDSSASEMRSVGITKGPIEIIHSGVAAEMRPGKKHDRPTILFLGRLRRYKGVRRLIDAFGRVRQQIPNARLVIAGSGDDELDLRAYAARVEGVEFTGAVDEETKIRLFQEAWVFGMPSALEGWGIVVIEAASCATPAVAFDVNGLRDCILDGRTGFLVKDDAEFGHALIRTLNDPALREQLAGNCVLWSGRFSWDRTAERTLRCIRRAQPWSAVFGTIENEPEEVLPVEVSAMASVHHSAH